MSSGPEECCVVGRVGRICFIRWTATPTAADARAVVLRVLEARQQAGGPLIGIGIVPAELSPPGIEAATEMLRLNPIIEQACEWAYVLIDGQGLRRALLHGFVTALAAPMRRPMTIVASLDEALAAACKRLGLEPGALLSEAQRTGLLMPSAGCPPG